MAPLAGANKVQGEWATVNKQKIPRRSGDTWLLTDPSHRNKKKCKQRKIKIKYFYRQVVSQWRISIWEKLTVDYPLYFCNRNCDNEK